MLGSNASVGSVSQTRLSLGGSDCNTVGSSKVMKVEEIDQALGFVLTETYTARNGHNAQHGISSSGYPYLTNQFSF